VPLGKFVDSSVLSLAEGKRRSTEMCVQSIAQAFLDHAPQVIIDALPTEIYNPIVAAAEGESEEAGEGEDEGYRALSWETIARREAPRSERRRWVGRGGDATSPVYRHRRR
jgi:hypothetical protein